MTQVEHDLHKKQAVLGLKVIERQPGLLMYPRPLQAATLASYMHSHVVTRVHERVVPANLLNAM